MAVDKLKIKTIEEGQTGQMVADNLKANFEFLADEIDKKLDSPSGGTSDLTEIFIRRW